MLRTETDTAKQIDEKAIQKKISQIIVNEKNLYNINQSGDDVKKATIFYLEQNGITLGKMLDVAKQGKLIIAGLELVVMQQENPAAVYKKLNMELHGINQASWNYYQKNYSSPKEIMSLEKMVPDTMDKIIDNGMQLFKDNLCNWLLFRKIIIEYDTMFTQSTEIDSFEKEQIWWSITIKKYKLEPHIEQAILRRLTLSDTLSKHDAELMTAFFDSKITP